MSVRDFLIQVDLLEIFPLIGVNVWDHKVKGMILECLARL